MKKSRKVCQTCGKEFEGSGNSKYCSIACRSKSPDIQKHVGEKWNELQITAAEWDGKRIIVTCKCSCGKLFKTRYDSVTSGRTPSCGHLTQFKTKDLTGVRNGKIVAVKRLRMGEKTSIWEVKCDCGNVREMTAECFVKSKSCGCDQHREWKNNVETARKNYCVDGTSLPHTKINKKPPRSSTSGHVGVSWDSAREKWTAQIYFKGKNYYLGRYGTLKEAVEIRQAAERAMFGGFHKEFSQKFPEIWEGIKDRVQ